MIWPKFLLTLLCWFDFPYFKWKTFDEKHFVLFNQKSPAIKWFDGNYLSCVNVSHWQLNWIGPILCHGFGEIGNVHLSFITSNINNSIWWPIEIGCWNSQLHNGGRLNVSCLMRSLSYVFCVIFSSAVVCFYKLFIRYSLF